MQRANEGEAKVNGSSEFLISLVVPVKNEEKTLEALVRSIQEQTRQPDEVILVDGGSTDRTVAMVRDLTAGDPRVRVIEAGPATPGRGRNIGIAAAQNDWVALTDAGIRLEPTWLQSLVEVAEANSNVRIVYGNYEVDVQSFFERCAARAYVPPKRGRSAGILRGPFIASSMLHRSVWEGVGGFPDLRAAEDLVFMERAEQLGIAIGWAPNATVWWRLQPSFSSTFRRFALYSKHNVWAGRQGDWHYGIARNYLIALVFIVLAAAHSPWWLAGLVLGALARVAKTFWVRRRDTRLLSIFNPALFAGVGLVLLAIDIATFVGWVQARCSSPPQPVSAANPPEVTPS